MKSVEYGLKRHFDASTARLLGDMVAAAHPAFDVDAYACEVGRRVPSLGLKDRVLVLAEGLREQLPARYPDAVQALLSVLGAELADGEGMFSTTWYLMPVARFVEEYGLEHPDLSLDAIEEITKRHTGEYAVRPYLEHHHDLAMARIRTWARDPSQHVRRLASEGVRPRLPWARTMTRFVADPRPVLAVLEAMRADPSPYVRRSVANNLNDVARDNPEAVLALAERWLGESPTDVTRSIVKHALRVLVKKGNPRALALLGRTGGEHIRVRQMHVSPPTVQLGETTTVSIELENTDRTAHTIAVDYVVHHLRPGGRTSPKIFKLATVTLSGGERQILAKTHPLREDGVRAYCSGRHRVDVHVNGQSLATDSFDLTT